MQLLDNVDSPLIRVGLSLALQEADLHVGEFAILLFRDFHLRGYSLSLMIQAIPVAQIAQAYDHHHGQDLQLGRPHIAHFDRRHGRGRARALAFAFGDFEQVDFDHRDSKLLRAKPTATAIWPGFCSTSSAPCPSSGGMTLWNGFSNSTGIENSCRNASTRPGTFDDPPAR